MVLGFEIEDYSVIDEEMRPIIKVLNQKGWATLYCCQGHYEQDTERYECTYITFFKPYFQRHEGHEPLFKEYINLSNGYPDIVDCTDKNDAFYYNHMDYTVYWYGTASKDMSKKEKDEEHKKLIEDLLEWANGLPELEDILNEIDVMA